MAHANRAGKTKQSSSELWHKRLGNPDSSVLSSLPILGDLSKYFDHMSSCDVSFCFKQTSDVFHESFKKAI